MVEAVTHRGLEKLPAFAVSAGTDMIGRPVNIFHRSTDRPRAGLAHRNTQ